MAFGGRPDCHVSVSAKVGLESAKFRPEPEPASVPLSCCTVRARACGSTRSSLSLAWHDAIAFAVNAVLPTQEAS